MAHLTSRLGFCLFPVLLSAAAVAQQASPDLSASLNPPPVIKQTPAPISPELRGDIYMARKMYREAIDMYRSLPETAQLDNKIGIAFHQMLDYRLAAQCYRRAITLEPRFGEAINNLGTVFYSQKQYKKAITYYRRALKNSGPKATEYANLGAAYFARKDYKKASEYYDQALEIDPSILENRGGFGTVMQEQTVSDLALFHLYLAKAYAKQGNIEEALVYLRRSLEEGLKDRKKLPEVPEFTKLKEDPGFKLLLAQNPQAL